MQVWIAWRKEPDYSHYPIMPFEPRPRGKFKFEYFAKKYATYIEEILFFYWEYATCIWSFTSCITDKDMDV